MWEVVREREFRKSKNFNKEWIHVDRSRLWESREDLPWNFFLLLGIARIRGKAPAWTFLHFSTT